ncbi:MAG: succinate dehydrogenase, hydrophobic membrane anchor protein [Proteobacteria bacterium]|nr:succinate dehydrogenase, hydrophobic membrane anchor protein [Pseudomonadota bacterium]
MSFETPLGRVRGLGSAKSGLEHWWHQRLTALALIPLTVWFAVSLVVIANGTYQEAVDWIRDPIVAGLMIVMLAAGYYHLKLGMQVIIEDYVHSEWLKISALIVVTFWCIALALASIMAVVWIWLGG